ncbi:MAG: glycosyltransferase [bacterium]|nr:glycosyltransferase [bacterium]
MATVSVVIPALDAKDTIALTINSLQSQTRLPDEIIIVVGPNDNTSLGLETVPTTVRFLKVNVPSVFTRDAQWKRREGARASVGSVIFFADSKALIEKHSIENALRLMDVAAVSVVAGISPDWPDQQQHLISKVHDHALIMNCPSFPHQAVLNKANFGHTESLPVTTALAMKREVFAAIEADFAVEFSSIASTYDDYLLSWLVVSAGYDILLTDQVIGYHKHRLNWKEYRRQISRSGQSAAIMLQQYPGCPFGQRRKIQVILIWAVLLMGMIMSIFSALHFGLAQTLLLGILGYSVLGFMNLRKAKWDPAGFVIPLFTIVLILTFSWHFSNIVLKPRETQQFDKRYFQAH